MKLEPQWIYLSNEEKSHAVRDLRIAGSNSELKEGVRTGREIDTF